MSDPELPPVQEQAPAPTSTLSIASLMMGIIGWILIPIVGGIIAIITGHMARKEIRQSDGRSDAWICQRGVGSMCLPGRAGPACPVGRPLMRGAEPFISPARQ